LLEFILTRQNAFDGAERPLTLSNSAGSGLTVALKTAMTAYLLAMIITFPFKLMRWERIYRHR